MTGPRLDLVVAVHDAGRPVARAVGSALDGAGDDVRATVVCHGLDPSVVEDLLPAGVASRVRLLEHRDGIRSPAGPFNAGLDAATAPYVAIMGSDDILEPGALAAWSTAAERTGADAVLAPMRHHDGQVIRTPRTRPLRSHRLDLVKDRLAYRTAPLGVLRRSTIDGNALRMTPGLTSGEDIAFSLRLYTLPSTRIDLGVGSPRYVVGADATDRVTTAVRPVAEELQAWEHLLAQPWFGGLTESSRAAIAIKAVRIHLLGAVRRRSVVDDWRPGEAAELGRLVRSWVEVARGVLAPQARADRDLLDVVLDPGASEADLAGASARRARADRWEPVLTRNGLGNLHREANLRHYVRMRLPV